MSDLGVDLGGLTSGQRDEVARHLAQTYHLNYGGPERQTALIFRMPMGSPELESAEPPAVFLRALLEAVRAGTAKVGVPRMSKPDRFRTSELLRQSASRPDFGLVSEALEQLRRVFDEHARIAGTSDGDRAEWITLKDTRKAVLDG